jgi:hypothetical protein
MSHNAKASSLCNNSLLRAVTGARWPRTQPPKGPRGVGGRAWTVF